MTPERLRELLDYDPLTGVFLWKVNRPKRPIGSAAGCKSRRGYRDYIRIGLDGRLYLAHVLAWLWMTGELPTTELDHKDLDGTNNKWSNIRPATRAQNCANRIVPKSSKTGIKGVQFRKNAWIARITIDGARVHLGSFRTKEAAQAVFASAVQQRHGEFARAA